ncbi:5-methylcytosine-specific restriction endonuclease McrBC, regulatory subunit McrC [Bacillus sp. OK048]|nr:5-methylcytosine-specific restriction endonuclease McrBC, regulatory subunit McrC [Bacillus sp. OK048]
MITMNDLFLIENKFGELSLSDDEIRHIQQINYYLGSNKQIINSTNFFSKNKFNTDTSNFIIIKNIRRHDGTPYIELKTENKVGILHTGEQPISIRPKINETHFMFIIDRSLQIRLRSKNEKVQYTDHNQNSLLLNYLIKVYLNSVNEYIRSWGIHTKYEKVYKKSHFLKGKINYVDTYLDILGGQTKFNVSFFELTGNTPVNRLIRQVLFKLRKSEFVQTAIQKLFTTRILQHFNDVDDKLEISDFSEATTLARKSNNILLKNIIDISIIILKHTYFYPHHSGNNTFVSFLIDSPILIEDGLREMIKESFKTTKTLKVSKSTKQINAIIDDKIDTKASKNATPDILIEYKNKKFVLDVKYKLYDINTNQIVAESDLYQLSAYIDIFHAELGIIIAFSKTTIDKEIKFTIGKKTIYLLFWSLAEKDPKKAKKLVIKEIDNLIKNKLM